MGRHDTGTFHIIKTVWIQRYFPALPAYPFKNNLWTPLQVFWQLWNICLTADDWYVPTLLIIPNLTYWINLIFGFVLSLATWWMPHVEYLRSPLFWLGLYWYYFVLYGMCCILYLVLWSSLFYPWHCQFKIVQIWIWRSLWYL